LPTYSEHKDKIINNFKVLKIGYVYDIKIGFGYIDNKNFVGFFYCLQNLKKAIKQYKIKDFDFSDYFLKNILACSKKNEPLFAHVSVNNLLANKTANRLMKHIANVYVYYP
jgi:hypothetical protein